MTEFQDQEDYRDQGEPSGQQEFINNQELFSDSDIIYKDNLLDQDSMIFDQFYSLKSTHPAYRYLGSEDKKQVDGTLLVLSFANLKIQVDRKMQTNNSDQATILAEFKKSLAERFSEITQNSSVYPSLHNNVTKTIVYELLLAEALDEEAFYSKYLDSYLNQLELNVGMNQIPISNFIKDLVEFKLNKLFESDPDKMLNFNAGSAYYNYVNEEFLSSDQFIQTVLTRFNSLIKCFLIMHGAETFFKSSAFALIQPELFVNQEVRRSVELEIEQNYDYKKLTTFDDPGLESFVDNTLFLLKLSKLESILQENHFLDRLTNCIESESEQGAFTRAFVLSQLYPRDLTNLRDFSEKSQRSISFIRNTLETRIRSELEEVVEDKTIFLRYIIRNFMPESYRESYEFYEISRANLNNMFNTVSYLDSCNLLSIADNLKALLELIPDNFLNQLTENQIMLSKAQKFVDKVCEEIKKPLTVILSAEADYEIFCQARDQLVDKLRLADVLDRVCCLFKLSNEIEVVCDLIDNLNSRHNKIAEHIANKYKRTVVYRDSKFDVAAINVFYLEQAFNEMLYCCSKREDTRLSLIYKSLSENIDYFLIKDRSNLRIFLNLISGITEEDLNLKFDKLLEIFDETKNSPVPEAFWGYSNFYLKLLSNLAERLNLFNEQHWLSTVVEYREKLSNITLAHDLNFGRHMEMRKSYERTLRSGVKFSKFDNLRFNLLVVDSNIIPT